MASYRLIAPALIAALATVLAPWGSAAADKPILSGPLAKLDI